MLSIVLSSQFKKDLKLASKRGYDISILDNIVSQLAEGKVLDPQYHDHELAGKFMGFRECHLKSDWLLVYRIECDLLQLFLFRTKLILIYSK